MSEVLINKARNLAGSLSQYDLVEDPDLGDAVQTLIMLANEHEKLLKQTTSATVSPVPAVAAREPETEADEVKELARVLYALEWQAELYDVPDLGDYVPREVLRYEGRAKRLLSAGFTHREQQSECCRAAEQ